MVEVPNRLRYNGTGTSRAAAQPWESGPRCIGPVRALRSFRIPVRRAL